MRPEMVGDPKHLSDLVQIEADVRIRCRTCGFEEDWTVPALAAHLRTIGGSTLWSEVTRYLSCRKLGCGSTSVRAIPVPYARRQANLPRRIGELDRCIVDAAIKVLDAASRRHDQSRASLEVVLALLVLHRYARDRDLIATCWRYASTGDPSVADSMRKQVELIRWRLVQRGWIARDDIVHTRVRTWTNPGPAPRGWRPMPDYGHEGEPPKET